MAEVTLTRLIFSLPEPLKAAAETAASRRGEALAVWVREAIREKLEREQA